MRHELHRHKLPLSSFDALATGGGGALVVSGLKSAARSRQLVLLRAVLDNALSHTDATGPLPSLEVAWDLLVRAQQADAQAVEVVLTHPNVGVWAVYSLRRLKGLISDDAPLWATLGYLHNIAAAAAIRAQVTFESDVLMHQGSVVLPTLGLARRPDDQDRQIAQLSCQLGINDLSGQTLPADLSIDGEGWLAMRRLTAGPLTVWLDDLDPYRGYTTPLLPNRLPDSDFRDWQSALTGAWELLRNHHPVAAEELSTGLRVLVPSVGEDVFTPYSATSREAFGSVALSLPPDPAEFAVTLIHEFAHSKLSALLDLVELHEPDPEPRFYAPWRDDPRPLGGLLQGIYSFLGIVDFWRTHRHIARGHEQQLAHFEFAHWRSQATKAAKSLEDDPKLTELGHRFVAGMIKQLDSWQSEPVPADLLKLADDACRDHQATWRLRNGKPAGKPLQEQPNRRTALLKLRLSDPAAFARLSPSDLPGATPGDFALVSGNNQLAAKEYREELAMNPNLPGPWIGLGLAAGSDALLDNASRARARYLVTGGDPVELASG